jgi:hypothetical protein
MAENTDLGITVEAWAKIVIERWERKIQQLKIYQTGKLVNSFTQFVNTQAGGNPDKIVFAFEYYGKFVDMGVGRGVKLGEVETSSRKAKPWYSKTFWSQFEKLKEIMVDKYQIKGQMSIITEIEQGNI